MPLSKDCAVELCKTFAASLLCGGSLLAPSSIPTGLVETAVGAAAIIATIAKDRSQEIDRIVEKVAKQVEKESGDWVRARGPGAVGKRQDALPAVQRAVLSFEPTGKELAALGLNRDRVIAFYLERAAKSDPIFGVGSTNEIARELLSDIVGYTFDTVRSAMETQSHVLEEILRRQEQLPDAVAAKVVDALENRLLQIAEQCGFDRAAIIALAKRLKPDENLSFEQAVRELEHAVEIALDLIAGGKQNSNLGGFIDAILRRIADETRAQQFERAAAEVDAGLREIALREVEQKADNLRARVAVIESGIKVDILRRDAEGVANRIEALMEFKTGARPSAWTTQFRAEWDRYWQQGREKGINFSLEIAAALATRMLRDSATARQRGDARNLLGNALMVLGEREGTKARLHEAIAIYRDALEECMRELTPLDWAGFQCSLANALTRLAQMDNDPIGLEESIQTYSDALIELEHGNDRLLWALAQQNLAHAYMRLGEMRSDETLFNRAISHFEQALTVSTKEQAPLEWATAQNNLGIVFAKIGEANRDTNALQKATVAFRNALQEHTSEQTPLLYAMTQRNLGNALRGSGEITGDARMFDDAILSYREALKNTREAAPLEWAMTQYSLGNALVLLFQLRSDVRLILEGLTAHQQAYVVLADKGAVQMAATVQKNIDILQQGLLQILPAVPKVE
jgi:tetratricopeptide (TPR) repeat protein